MYILPKNNQLLGNH